ncbi:PSD1 and planctomycete cytochrome C domain-containing protein [Planctomicrobium sp. SH668]|uniref:PSD1 and planctomycete cytochrome C domain-containing protein n=1 Tax=Planctomicrobium sp. SH668 TaxID=3448126 RepID=UPI003F5B923F
MNLSLGTFLHRLFVHTLAVTAIYSAASINDVRADMPNDQEGVEYFEKHVRPLFIAKCNGCHGAQKQWAELRLDSSQSILKGGENGPAIVPGDPEQSLLISAVRRLDGLEMPPDNPLSADEVNALEQWVKMGAPWPKETSAAADREELFRTHWSFQPMSRSVPPQVTNPEWCKTPVDQFVLSKLHAAGLTPSDEASRRTLIRRITFDLTGLPPSQEEVDAFLADTDPNAYERLVERLLASPHYGEHWARKWMDLARYADTKGYTFGREENRFVHSWVYRDWLVGALNNDLPYNRFLELQIAADQTAPDDPAAQAALGFLTLGRRFLGNTPDIIDDRIDVLSRTTMGLTISCARCHDHKYDPIPTADYYSLYGVFQNCVEERHRVNAGPSQLEEHKAALAQFQEKQDTFNRRFDEEHEKAAARVRARVADHLMAQTELDKYPGESFSQILEPDDIKPSYVHRWVDFLSKSKDQGEPVFLAWHLYAEIPNDQFIERAVEVTRSLKEERRHEIHARVAAAFQTPPASLQEVAQRYGDLFLQVEAEWRAALKSAEEAKLPAPTGFANEQQEQLRTVLYGPTSPCSLPAHNMVAAEYFFDIGTVTALWGLDADIDRWLIDNPHIDPHALRLVDKGILQEPRIFRRGNPATKGDVVPRQFPVVVAGAERKPFQQGSGRKELAEGIIASSNPLTARVWVNRIWQNHFGVGIVPTPSDFGTRAPKPEHHELLDWLALQLIDNGWSTKSIHRLIVLSSTYRQQSTGPAQPEILEQAGIIDPTNQLLWKMNPRRLSFEEMRDAMLAATSDLELTLSGPSTQLFTTNDQHHRRTLYGYIDRQGLPDTYRVFDFANPDLHVPTRSETTVSQQALFSMNHPFIATRARQMAKVIQADESLTKAQQVEALYSAVFQRQPTEAQKQMAVSFLESAPADEAPPPTMQQKSWEYGYGKLSDDGKKLESFALLPFFNGTAWQGGATWPDAALGWAQLTAEGGHPGNTSEFAVVRRWKAPTAGQISIQSNARHEVPDGSGILFAVISSRTGSITQFPLHNSSQVTTFDPITVEAGETIDFIVDVKGELGHDQFLWSVDITAKQPVEGAPSKWNSVNDFNNTVTVNLDALEQLAQVLFLSNEFLFVD